MITTGVLVVKGWQHFGPSTDRVKTLAVAAYEKAQATWSGTGEAASGAPSLGRDPRFTAGPAVTATVPAATTSSPLAAAPQLIPSINADNGTSPADEKMLAATAPVVGQLEADGVSALLAKLHELGVSDAQVGPWGSGGLYRCCCQANLTAGISAARHFEAVAGEPSSAVAQVVAKVEAWRSTQ